MEWIQRLSDIESCVPQLQDLPLVVYSESEGAAAEWISLDRFHELLGPEATWPAITLSPTRKPVVLDDEQVVRQRFRNIDDATLESPYSSGRIFPNPAMIASYL